MAKATKGANGGPKAHVKFVGRYTVVRPRDTKKSSEVRIFAPKLDHPDIRLLSHFVSLTIDSRHVTSGMETAIRAIPVQDGDYLRELLIWDLGGCDVEFLGYQPQTLTVTLPDHTKPNEGAVVPDLLKLATGRCSIDPELLRSNVPPDKPVSTRVNLVGGDVTCDYEGFGMPDGQAGASEGEDSYKYTFGAANDHSRVQGSAKAAVELADTITWTIGCGDTFGIRLRAFDGKGARTIHCATIANAIRLTISNTCAAGIQINRDHEFASYYDLLSSPVAWADRMVPVLAPDAQAGKLDLMCDGTDHCSGSSQIVI